MQIDAHQHYWRLERGDYGWLTPKLGPIYRDFLPPDLAPILVRHGIAKTILVQAAPTVAETLFLLDLGHGAKRPDTDTRIAGVVGWVDFEEPSAPDVIRRLASDRLLVGLRPMVHDIADPDWLLRDTIAPAIACMIEQGLTFDALVRQQHLPALRGFVERYPGLQIVIDHGAKPEIARGVEQPWLDQMTALAENPTVVCKISGLITEAGCDWKPEMVQPYIARLLKLFGPSRLLWGSDWPVVNLAGDYDVWRALTGEALQDLSLEHRAAILGGNAARIYLGNGRGNA